MKSYLKFIIPILCISSLCHATTRKVLFIGDSYTYVNNMPLMLQTLAANLGDTLIYDQSDPGGFTLQLHSTYGPTISKIFSQQWDVVVIQEQSERPAFPPSQVDTQVYPYAHILDSMIAANDSCTQTMFMMTWGHADGDPANCPYYPVICTYDGMQQRLHDSYMQMAQDNHAVTAPVGVAWKVVRDSFPALWLYQTDSTHPLVSGSYLESCVLYGSIFHKHTFGSTYLDGLSASDAATLQRIADKVTLDSLSQWQQYGHYPYAGFTCSLSGNTASFLSIDSLFSSGHWTFGDATGSTNLNPVHIYSANGEYVITHTVATDCFTETQTDTVHISETAVNNVESAGKHIQVIQNAGNVTFIAPDRTTYDQLEVYSADGRLSGHYNFAGNKITSWFLPGLYIYKAFSQHGNMTVGKFVVN